MPDKIKTRSHFMRREVQIPMMVPAKREITVEQRARHPPRKCRISLNGPRKFQHLSSGQRSQGLSHRPRRTGLRHRCLKGIRTSPSFQGWDGGDGDIADVWDVIVLEVFKEPSEWSRR